jgi:hypothetical protein
VRRRLSLTGGTQLSGGASTRVVGWAGLNSIEFGFSFSLNFELLFFLFSLGNSNQIQTQFKIQKTQTCASNKSII